MKQVISTSHAPAALGPYSQAIACGDLLFVSGQLPIDPASGQLVEGDIAVRTRRIMDSIAVNASAAGTTISSAVKTTIFLTDLRDFHVVNEAYGRYFPTAPPARSTVQVAALPLGANIEIEMVISLPR